MNPINQIPNSGADVNIILKMDIHMIFDILKFVILEVPVIFFCEKKLSLVNMVKSFEEIIFPFSYPFPVIEILPKVYYKSLEKLSCFLVGINQKYKNEFFQENGINLNDKEFVAVDIREEQVKYHYFNNKKEKYGILLKDFSGKIEKNQKVNKISKKDIKFPQHYLDKLIKNISNLLIDENRLKKKINDIKSEDIRYVFFYFFISMFQNYKSFLELSPKELKDAFTGLDNYNKIDIKKMFKCDEFISKDMDTIDFYGCFLDTKIFKNFLIKNLFPSTIEEKMEILLLDENIRKKKNKKMKNKFFQENTYFLDSDIFKIKDNNVERIRIDNYNNIEMYSKIKEESKIINFPLLDDKKMESIYINNFLNKDVQIKNLYVEFYTECLRMLKEKKFLDGYSNIGYNINITDTLKPNKEPYVLKLWILLICYSFNHLDLDEKWIIVYEFLYEIRTNILLKNTIIDPFLSEIIFSTFTKYGDKQMCSLIYKELYEFTYIKEDYITFMKLHKKFINDKNEYEKVFPKNTFLKKRNYNIFNLPKNTKMEIVLINPHSQCQRVDLYPTIINFKEQDDYKLMFGCPICHKFRKATITVSIGKENNEDISYQLYSSKALFYAIKELGDYDMQTFYKEHTEIFFNLIILFQLRGIFYEFLFPYKNWIPKKEFDINKLEEEKIKFNFVKKDKNKNKPKWYDVIEEKEGRVNILSKIMPSKVSNVENFKKKEIINSIDFFKKYEKKIVKNNMRLTKKKKLES